MEKFKNILLLLAISFLLFGCIELDSAGEGIKPISISPPVIGPDGIKPSTRAPDLIISKIELGEAKLGEPLEYEVFMKNIGNTRYTGLVYVRAWIKTPSARFTSYTPRTFKSLIAGQEETIMSDSFTPTETGEYTIFFSLKTTNETNTTNNSKYISFTVDADLKLTIATLKDKYKIGESVNLTDPPTESTLFSNSTQLFPNKNSYKEDIINELLNSEEWKKFENEYNDNWTVKWDTLNKTPEKIFGKNIDSTVFGIATVTQDNMDSLAKKFINSNEELFKIEASNLKIVKNQQSDKLNVISYQQQHSNIPVFGSYVTIATKNNKIIMYKSSYKTDISVQIKPKITRNEAKNIAKQFFNISKTLNIKNTELVVYPLKTNNYALTYQIDFPLIENQLSEEKKPYIQPTVFVDAINGGVIDYFDKLIYENLSGTVTGMIYPVFIDQSPISVPFKSEFVNANGSQGITNENGFYEIMGLSGNVNVNGYLEGPWAKVYNVQQEEAFHSATVTVPGTHNWNWQNYDESYLKEESNAYYHTNVIHDYVTKQSLDVNEVDFQIEVNVNHPAHCNAFYTWNPVPSINFYSAGNGCESTAVDASIVYHEYGHAITDHLTPEHWPYIAETGNMHEGFSDYWACTILDDACTGKSIGEGDCIRRCDTQDRYPENYDLEPHSGAQIISAPFWELRQLHGANYSDNLLVNAVRLNPQSFGALLENVLIVDDNNENLSDGTPRIDDICHSFYDNHGIFSVFCIDHTTTGVAQISSPTLFEINLYTTDIITIEGTAYGSSTIPLDNYTLEYSNVNDPLTWLSDGITIAGKEVIDDILGQWNVSNLEGMYNLRVKVEYGDNIIYSYPIQLVIDHNLREGWPVYTGDTLIGSTLYGSPLIGNVDNVGNNEIIYSSGIFLRVYNSDGNIATGWDGFVNRICDFSPFKPALGDLDNDGNNEVIAEHCSAVETFTFDGFRRDRFDIGKSIKGSPTLADLDFDGKLEIIVGADDGNLYVFDRNLTLLWSKSTIGKIRSSASVGDINNDESKEIVVTSYNYNTQEYIIYILNSDGTDFAEPVMVELTRPDIANEFSITQWYDSSPAIADLDGDQHLEIIVGLPDASIGAWNENGELLWRYDTGIIRGSKRIRSPSIGDIDNDGDIEIIFTVNKSLYILDHKGELVSGWPNTYSTKIVYSSPVLFDIDNDRNLEILSGGDKKVHVFKYDGEEIYQNSFFTQGTVYSTPTIGDLDKNKKPDIVVGANQRIYAWELDTDYSNLNQGWPELHFDNKNSGYYFIPKIKSQIQNFDNIEASGFLTLKVQKLVGTQWQDAGIIINEQSFTVPPKGVLGLDTIWNPISWNPKQIGQYRVFAEFSVGSETWSSEYEFAVSR